MKKRQLAALLALLLLLGLCACGKKSDEAEPEQSDAPEERILAGQDMGVVSALARELSAEQMELITGSIEITDGLSSDGGAEVALISAMGDGCYNCFNLLISLPEKSKVKGGGCGFRSAEILFNDDRTPFKTTMSEWTALEDDNPKDSSYSLRLTVGTTRWEDREQALNNGVSRTLRLTDIVSEDGSLVLQGQWSFEFLYALECEYAELIEKPLPIAGISEKGGNTEECWAELKSLVLSSFSAECRFKTGLGAGEPVSYGLSYVEMKSGEKRLISCSGSRIDGADEIRNYNFIIPINLGEVKSIHLMDKVTVEAA